MKKGLITAIGTILLAIAGSSHANAPTISGIPDVVISDKEDNGVGATVDLNFFRYANAFNILNYAHDADTTPNLLKFAFQEENTVNNLTINGKAQQLNVSGSMPAPSAWTNVIPTNDVANGYWFSFRDILRTPTPDPTAANPKPNPKRADGTSVTSTTTELLPWSTAAGLNTLAGNKRSVTIFVGDEADNTASDVINVYSQNNGSDALSGSAVNYSVILTDSGFPTADWTFGQSGFTMYSAATSSGGGGGGFLGLTTGTTAAAGGAYWSRWIQSSPGNVAPIPFVETANVIYAAKMTLQLNSVQNNVKALSPDLRLGVENALQSMVMLNTLNSYSTGDGSLAANPDTDNPQIPAVGSTMSYGMYWSPNNQLANLSQLKNVGGVDFRRFRVFFDVIDLNTGAAGREDAGTWRMTSLTIYTLDRPATVAPVAGSSNFFKLTDLTSAAANANGGGFHSNTAFSDKNVTITQNSPAAGQITFHAPAATTQTYGLWEKDDTVPWTAGKVIRVTPSLSCPTQTDRDNFAIARFRHSTRVDWVDQQFAITGIQALIAGSVADKDLYLPQTTATPYEIYVPTWGGPNAFITGLGATYTKFILGIDHINRGTTDLATNWTVNSVQYEVLDSPIAGVN